MVLSGGVAPGLADRFPEKVRTALEGITHRLVVDTSKGALQRLISEPVAPLHVLRFDQREAERAAMRPLADLQESIGFLTNMITRVVAETRVMGLGAEGSLLVTSATLYICRTPKLPVVSKVGAGDAFIGGLTLALQRGDGLRDALRWGGVCLFRNNGDRGYGAMQGKRFSGASSNVPGRSSMSQPISAFATLWSTFMKLSGVTEILSIPNFTN